MQLVKSIIPKKTNTLQQLLTGIKGWQTSFIGFLFFLSSPAFSQDNSPYSRYGIGDLVPPTNILNRGIGGISAGFSDFLSINFNNPASYSAFQTLRELKSNKLISGRAILDIGVDFESRTLQETSPVRKFVANNALFSYVQVGMPLKTNWGLSFGLRPVSRISYKIIRSERLKDPITQLPIDSAITQFNGDGGSYLASLGTGYKIRNFSIGFNVGYLFGKKDYEVRRSLINDTVDYLQANYETKTTFGNISLNLGAQYKLELNKKISMTLGAFGNWGQKLNASKDIIRETFFYDANAGNTRLDSVSEQRNIKGKIIYPASFTIGFVTEKAPQAKEANWLFGLDFTRQSWNNYRVYGQSDSVQNNWELRVGGQLRPVPKKSYWSNVAYRAGFFAGPDYIKVNEKISRFGISFGMGLPVANYNRLSQGQATIINLAIEYSKRGNNNNLLKENMVRVSLGFSLSDFWFVKRKYE